MKIAIIGSGGREHALAATISRSSNIDEIFCIPGNAGTLEVATNVELDVNELTGVAIMTDTDNSKLKAIAYYQNIYFSSK